MINQPRALQKIRSTLHVRIKIFSPSAAIYNVTKYPHKQISRKTTLYEMFDPQTRDAL